MKRTIIKTFTVLCILLTATPSWGADFDKGLAAYENGDFKVALNEWVPLAEEGDAKAQAALGEMHDFGNGVKQDYKLAAKWYRLAAEQGDAESQYHLGVMHDNGDGISQDYKLAAKWYRLAAAQKLA